MAQVVITDSADADSVAIIAELDRLAGRRVANKYENLFDDLYEQLADYPASGPARAKLGKDIRLGVVNPYIIIYRHYPAEDIVRIMRIIHGSRKITRKMLKG